VQADSAAANNHPYTPHEQGPMSYHTKVESKLSEVGPFPPGYWFLQINTERNWVPGVPPGFFALMFKDDVTQEEAERFEKLFDRMVQTLSS
jgi:hypothetical protein